MNGKINAFISNKLYSKIPVGGIRNRLYSVLLNAENIKIGWNIHIDNINIGRAVRASCSFSGIFRKNIKIVYFLGLF